MILCDMEGGTDMGEYRAADEIVKLADLKRAWSSPPMAILRSSVSGFLKQHQAQRTRGCHDGRRRRGHRGGGVMMGLFAVSSSPPRGGNTKVEIAMGRRVVVPGRSWC